MPMLPLASARMCTARSTAIPTHLLERAVGGFCSSKMRIYGREGVAHAWLVDPLARTLEIYHRAQGPWTVVAVTGGNDLVRGEPFDAIEVALERWWIPEDAPQP